MMASPLTTHRIVVREAETLIGQIFPVLDHGEIQLVEYMGGDELICRAARVSYGEIRRPQQENRSLIRYLLRHRHTSPFEQVILTFRIKAPIFVFRQWIRHRTARLNELSGRYTKLPEEFYIPSEDQVRAQSAKNKQGRDGELDPQVVARFLEELTADCQQSFETYEEGIEDGVARELARIGLPLSTYSAMYWQIDLHNLMHFLGLRLEEGAQWEIRQYAQVMYDIAKTVAPFAVEAFDDYILGAITFSRKEAQLLEMQLKGVSLDSASALDRDYVTGQLGSPREMEEFFRKIQKLQAQS